MPDVRVDLLLEPRDLAPEFAVQDGQGLVVEDDARGLHPREDGDERQLDLAEQPIQSFATQRRFERLAHGDRRQRL